MERIYGIDIFGDPSDNNIPDYLSGSMCGGWDTNESVDGKIATVSGVPGRGAQWDGAITSGMGKRNDDFTYPAEATGHTTSCDDATTTIDVEAFDEAAERVITKTIDYPYFEDPPCRWRGVGNQLPTPESPTKCQEFCTWLNGDGFQYDDCFNPFPKKEVNPADNQYRDIPNAFTCGRPLYPSDPGTPAVPANPGDPSAIPPIPPTPAIPELPAREEIPEIPARWGKKYTCTQQWVPGSVPDANGDAEDPAGPEPDLQNITPNCRTPCTGDECRCPGPNCLTAANGQTFRSFYRHYNGSFTRDAVPVVAGDVANKNAEVACYGFYNEFDTKDRKTEASDRRCVINMQTDDLPASQQGKGEYGANQLPDFTPTDAANLRNAAYDSATDIWFQNLGGGFSLLNEQVFSSTYKKNIGDVFLNLDTLDSTSLKSLPQINNATPMAKTSMLRAFDDSGENRSIVTWWQRQETQAAKIFRRPVLRLLLPAGWAMGLDATDPILSTSIVSIDTTRDRRSQSVEVQIQADEDLLGKVLKSLERSLLLKIEEEPIPVVVPTASPTELRALANAWCAWDMRKRNVSTCTVGAPAQVTQLIARLEEYADRIEDVRKLRGELTRFAGSLLTYQQQITQPIRTWLEQNQTAYQDALNEQQTMVTDLLPLWTQAVNDMQRFSNKSNRPWCMNQRFTTPIFSLLDEWSPTRDDAGSRGTLATDPNQSFPDLSTLQIARSADFVVDFSTIRRTTGTVKLPVLKPIQLAMTSGGPLPTPPDIGLDHGITSIPPALPSIEPIQTAIRAAALSLPTVIVASNPPPIVVPEPLGAATVNSIQATLTSISNLLGNMNSAYERFWTSVTPFPTEEPDIHAKKIELECDGWDESPCVHVEMDLRERFQRLGSRPEIGLQEDETSVGQPRLVSPTCLSTDDGCLVLPSERLTPPVRWEIRSPPENTSAISTLKQTIRNLTLPVPLGNITDANSPPYLQGVQSLLPALDVPSALDILP